MGTSRWSADDWKGYSATTSTKSTSAIFTAASITSDLDPTNVNVRESRDSDVNPNSTAISVACDVTGSMDYIADYFIKEGLGILFGEILDRKPVTDPHLMVNAVGDFNYDRSPFQVSQFEADLTIAKWLEKVHIEHGGGGNNSESYHGPLYFASRHTSIDCFEKRGKKGYLFTIGDEEVPPALTRKQIEKFFGDKVQADLTYEQLLEEAERTYNVYHIIVAEGSHCRYSSSLTKVQEGWRKVLGQRAITLTDYKALSEVIVSLIQVNEGEDVDAVADSWSGTTAVAVRNATADLAKRDNRKVVNGSGAVAGVVKF